MNKKKISQIVNYSVDDISRELAPNIRNSYDDTMTIIRRKKMQSNDAESSANKSVIEMDKVKEQSVKSIKGIDKCINNGNEQPVNNVSDDRGVSAKVSSISNTLSESTLSLISVTYSGFKELIHNIELYSNTHINFSKKLSESVGGISTVIDEMDKRSKISNKVDTKKQFQLEDMLSGNVTVGKIMSAVGSTIATFKGTNDGVDDGSTVEGPSALKSSMDGLIMYLSQMFFSNLDSKKANSKLVDTFRNGSRKLYDYLIDDKDENSGLRQTKVAKTAVAIGDKLKNSKFTKYVPLGDELVDALSKENIDMMSDSIGSKIFKGIFGDKLADKFSTKNTVEKTTAVSFDMSSHNAINTIIPGYLAKILSALSGQEEIAYHYSSGKFKKTSTIRQDHGEKLRKAVLGGRGKDGKLDKGNEKWQRLAKNVFGEKYTDAKAKYDEVFKDLVDKQLDTPEKIKTMLNDDNSEILTELLASMTGEGNEYKLKDLASSIFTSRVEKSKINRSDEYGGSTMNAFNDDTGLDHSAGMDKSTLEMGSHFSADNYDLLTSMVGNLGEIKNLLLQYFNNRQYTGSSNPNGGPSSGSGSIVKDIISKVEDYTSESSNSQTTNSRPVGRNSGRSNRPSRPDSADSTSSIVSETLTTVAGLGNVDGVEVDKIMDIVGNVSKMGVLSRITSKIPKFSLKRKKDKGSESSVTPIDVDSVIGDLLGRTNISPDGTSDFAETIKDLAGNIPGMDDSKKSLLKTLLGGISMLKSNKLSGTLGKIKGTTNTLGKSSGNLGMLTGVGITGLGMLSSLLFGGGKASASELGSAPVAPPSPVGTNVDVMASTFGSANFKDIATKAFNISPIGSYLSMSKYGMDPIKPASSVMSKISGWFAKLGSSIDSIGGSVSSGSSSSTGGTTTGSTGTASANGITGTNQEIVWKFLRANGYSEAAAAGVMGNIQQECGFNPSAVEAGNNIGHGLFQWSFDRWSGPNGLDAYAKSKGKDWTDIGLQIEFMNYEVTQGGESSCFAIYGYNSSLAGFKGQNDVNYATEMFCWSYERPSAIHANMTNRLNWANTYYNQFKGTSSTSTATADNSSTQTSGSTASAQSGSTMTSTSGTGSTTTGGAGNAIPGNTASSSKREKAVQIALQQLGKPYGWGAKGPNTFDCSGLVTYSYTQAGVPLPNERTQEMFNVNTTNYTKVSASQLSRGDLVMMDTFYDPSVPNHVGIYLGDGTFVEAGDPICITKLVDNSPYYKVVGYLRVNDAGAVGTNSTASATTNEALGGSATETQQKSIAYITLTESEKQAIKDRIQSRLSATYGNAAKAAVSGNQSDGSSISLETPNSTGSNDNSEYTSEDGYPTGGNGSTGSSTNNDFSTVSSVTNITNNYYNNTTNNSNINYSSNFETDKKSLDIMKSIFESTSSISKYTKEAWENIIKIVEKVRTSNEYLSENNELADSTNELLKNLKLQYINIEGGNGGTSDSPRSNGFELDVSIMENLLRGT